MPTLESLLDEVEPKRKTSEGCKIKSAILAVRQINTNLASRLARIIDDRESSTAPYGWSAPDVARLLSASDEIPGTVSANTVLRHRRGDCSCDRTDNTA